MWTKIRDLHSSYDKVLVGISLLSGNTDYGFQLARQCAEDGIDVVIGGPETAGYGSVNIMRTRPYIKYGVDGLGERVLHQIIADTPLDEVPGLTYRENSAIRQNQTDPKLTRLNWLNIAVDYSLLDNLEGNVGTTYLTGNDCFIAEKRCYFCGRLGMGNPQTTEEIETRVERVWNEIKYAWDVGLTHYFNSADSALRSPKLFKAFAEARPEWFKPRFHHLFANAHELTPEVMPTLKRLSATVYLGVENAAIENHGKGKIHFSVLSDNRPDMMSSRRALEILHENAVPMRLSFVFGDPGETRETLARNLGIIVGMVEKYPTITDLELNPIEVLPGTQAFQDLMRLKGDKYREKEVPYDTLEMSKDLVPLVSKVTRDEVLEWIAKMYKAVLEVKPEIRVNTKSISWKEFERLGGER